MRELVIEIQKGGLGDHLFYSHLPRIAKETGAFDEVRISNRSLFRNADNKKLVWELNPFVDGFTDAPGIYHFPQSLNEGENLPDRIMLMYGLDDGKRFHEPEIYYRPLHKPELAHLRVYDPNFISYTGDVKTAGPIAAWLRANHECVDFQMTPLAHRYLPLPDVPTMKTDSLLDFCSLIVSCRQVYCLTTGTATLAAAMGVPVTVFYGTGHDPLYRHSSKHRYIHVGSDFAIKDRVKKRVVLFLTRFLKLGVR